MEIKEHVPLAPLTTFGVGGAALYFVDISSADELKEALKFASEKKLKVLVLGGGSNVLVDDAGFDGLVIKINLPGLERKENSLVAGAGESWDSLVERAVQENLWGIENLSGIPGSVGGAVAGNIGAYGQALSQTLAWAEVLDTESGEIKHVTNAECAFGYRESVFSHVNTGSTPRFVIVRAAFELSKEQKPDISYRDLAERFKDSSLSLGAIREAVLIIRASKFPDLKVEGTAGSFFKNPVLAREEAKKLQEKYPAMPVFGLPESSGVKIPLAWLLDKVLNLRGVQVGDARLYEKQPLVIVATKNGSSKDIKNLSEIVKEKVKKEFDIEITPEVKIIER